MESYLMSSYGTRHYQTASSSSHCCFTFLDGNQSCAVIKIWFCAASPGKQVWFQEERKQLPSIWHTRVITGGHALGHLYLVLGEVERCSPTIWAQSCPPGECSHRSVWVRPSPLLTDRQPLPCRLKINFAVCCKMRFTKSTCKCKLNLFWIPDRVAILNVIRVNVKATGNMRRHQTTSRK